MPCFPFRKKSAAAAAADDGAAEEPAEEPEPSVDAAQSDSENETTSEDSNWKHDDVDMMFAEAMAAREA